MASKDINQRKTYSFAFKLKVIAYAEEKGKHTASKLFNVDRKRVCEWCQKKSIIEQGTKTQKRQSGAGRPLNYNDRYRGKIDFLV